MIFTETTSRIFYFINADYIYSFFCVFSESKIWKQYSNYKTLTKQRNTTLVQITNN